MFLCFCSVLAGGGSLSERYDLNRTCKGLWKIWIKWVYLVSILAVIELLLYKNWVGLKGLLDAFMFNMWAFNDFISEQSSTWFMSWYFLVVLGNTIVMLCAQKMGLEIRKTYCGILLAGYFAVVFGIDFFGLQQWYLFFSFFWMLGNLLHDIKIDRPAWINAVLVLGALYVVTGKAWGVPLEDLQASKFPPQPLYLCASLFAIVTILYYRGKYPKWIVHIGQNAIFYFMGQGIGSSFMFLIVPRMDWIRPWYLEAVAALAINLIMSVTISEFLLLLWKAGRCLIGKWKEALRPAA